jgi:hypothetical protein
VKNEMFSASFNHLGCSMKEQEKWIHQTREQHGKKEEGKDTKPTQSRQMS